MALISNNIARISIKDVGRLILQGEEEHLFTIDTFPWHGGIQKRDTSGLS